MFMYYFRYIKLQILLEINLKKKNLKNPRDKDRKGKKEK